jgi:hypothetical protein
MNVMMLENIHQWLTFAGSAFQLSIVLLSASILAVSMGMFYASVGVGLFGALLMSRHLVMDVIHAI